jgi:hypothetical protein
MPRSPDPASGDEQPSQGWQQRETLGVTEVVVTILRARKIMPLATAATVSRKRHGDAFHVRVRLMNDPPAIADGDAPDSDGSGWPGAVIADFITRQLETDLADAFGSKDVIILK